MSLIVLRAIDMGERIWVWSDSRLGWYRGDEYSNLIIVLEGGLGNIVSSALSSVNDFWVHVDCEVHND